MPRICPAALKEVSVGVLGLCYKQNINVYPSA